MLSALMPSVSSRALDTGGGSLPTLPLYANCHMAESRQADEAAATRQIQRTADDFPDDLRSSCATVRHLAALLVAYFFFVI
jgi:hypothetical protein